MRKKQQAALRNSFGLTHQIKTSCLCNKNFLKEICRNIQTYAFNVLPKCSFGVHRNSAEQVFYLTLTRDMFSGKFVKWARFLAVLLEYIFYNIEWVEAFKMKFFERNCTVLVLCLRFIWIIISSDHRRVWMNCEQILCIWSSYLTH